MKNLAMPLFAVFGFSLLTVCFFDLGSLSSVSAQSGERVNFHRFDVQSDRDRKMAAEIRRDTNRDPGHAKQTYTSNGVVLEYDGGFQNVALARMQDDGSIASVCITSVEEANGFFGRDLYTGDQVAKTRVPKRETERLAADHGMSESEFIFYTNLIEDARQQRAMSPNAATINIVNADLPGVGFNDATPAFSNPEGGNTGSTKGAQRLNVFNFAAGIWSAFLDTNVPIQVQSRMNSKPCSSGGAVLGSAGAYNGVGNFPNAELTNTWYHIALANKQAGFDLIPANPDIDASFNVDIDSGCLFPGSRWYYGLDNSTPSLRLNLLVVLLHEIGHGLGFATYADGSTGQLNGGLPDVWSRYMFDSNTGLFWNSPTMTNAQRHASARSNGALRWDGPNVKIASSFMSAGREAVTGRVELYAPATYESGSSVSHFNILSTPDLLMEPNINAGLGIDGDLTRQLLRDIGWYRDSTANVVADTITAVTPDGSSAVVMGTVQNINWTNNGSFNRNVTIELSTDGGATYPDLIASNIPNSGTYAWTVPVSPTSIPTARVRVREYDFAAPLGTSSANFTISTAPLAGNAAIWGRVVDPAGRAVSRATVTLVGGDGIARTSMTNSFGFFVFDEVPVGETYVASVRHRRYNFEQRVVNLVDDLTGLDFTGTE